MRRLRTTYVDDWEDLEIEERSRARIFGVSINPIVAWVVAAVGWLLFLALFFSSLQDWFPKSPVLRWTLWSIAIAFMSVTTFVCLVSIRALIGSIRRSRIQMARLDGATDQEARQEGERYIRRNVYLRLVVYLALGVTIWLFLGSPFIFDWAGPIPYLCGMAVYVICVMLVASGRVGRIWDSLRGVAGGR